ncbi:MAG: hypothetical protein SWX82_19950 [Cyanobacteriota bacterium]|nr:hypothetical protein [Cyanobacteriota bacterium]
MTFYSTQKQYFVTECIEKILRHQKREKSSSCEALTKKVATGKIFTSSARQGTDTLAADDRHFVKL